jgi:hypothetical protein
MSAAQQVGYYVTLRRDVRSSALLGPYDTHREALDNVDRGHGLAVKADPWASFDAIGTAAATGERLAPGVFGR